MAFFSCKSPVLGPELTDVAVAQLLNAEYRQYPTERNYERLEMKAQVLQRLKSQLSSISTPSVFDHQDVSNYLLVVMCYSLCIAVNVYKTQYLHSLVTELLQCFDTVGWMSGRASGP